MACLLHLPCQCGTMEGLRQDYVSQLFMIFCCADAVLSSRDLSALSCSDVHHPARDVGLIGTVDFESAVALGLDNHESAIVLCHKNSTAAMLRDAHGSCAAASNTT